MLTVEVNCDKVFCCLTFWSGLGTTLSILQFSYLLPVFGANEVVSGDGEDCLEVEGGPGGGVEGEGSDGAVDVICTAVPDTTRIYVLNRKKVEGWVVVILQIFVCLQNASEFERLCC